MFRFIFFLCTLLSVSVFCFGQPSGDSPENENGGIPSNPVIVIRRSMTTPAIALSYNGETLYLNSTGVLNDITLRVTEIDTGNCQEYYLGTIEGDVSLPIQLSEGTYLLEIENSLFVLSVVLSIEINS